jgi:hypothetical protein
VMGLRAHGSAAGGPGGGGHRGGGAGGAPTVWVDRPVYSVNFAPELTQIIRECKYMDRLGVTVPASVRDVALQKDKYHDLVESLQAMLGYVCVCTRIPSSHSPPASPRIISDCLSWLYRSCGKFECFPFLPRFLACVACRSSVTTNRLWTD